jgi:hypothetical protein
VRLAEARLELGDLLVGDQVGLQQVLDVLVGDELGIDEADAILERDAPEPLPAGLAADRVDPQGDEGVLHLPERLDLHVGVLHVEVDAGDVQVLAQLLDRVALLR